MRGLKKILADLAMIATLTPAALLAATEPANSAEYVVYSVYKGLDMGNPGEVPQKDFYVNMGSTQGLHPGSTLDVLRRVATYDLLNEKLYKDVTFPIARLKVLHVEAAAAICRLEKTLPPEKTPAVATHAVMVGDLVRPAQ
jgi:hypothetical protein